MPDWSASAELPANEGAPAVARRLLTELLLAWHHERQTADANIVVSELVTNAIQHASDTGSLELTVSGTGGTLQLSLADGSVARPLARDVNADTEHGRGMRIVEQLTANWRVEECGTGKRVWVEFC